MLDALGVQAARRRFSSGGAPAVGADVVRPAVLASWERSAAHGVETGKVASAFTGHDPGSPLVADGVAVLDRFARSNPDAGASVLLVDADGVVRARRDTDPALGELLDEARLVPGHQHAERLVGTNAAALALHDGRDAVVSGPEHFHPELAFLGSAAALVHAGPDAAVVVVCCHGGSGGTTALPVARMLAREVADQARARRREAVLALHEAFDVATGRGAPWVVATDGDVVLLGTGTRRTAPPDQQALGDLALAAVVLDGEPAPRHVDLPSGTCAEVVVTDIRCDGHYVGCVLEAGPAEQGAGTAEAEARRRQGSHVAPTGRRDFAADLRAAPGTDRAHSAARVRANRELLTPYLRARQEVAANVGQGRHQLLIGEAGTGKRTLVLDQVARRHPDAAVLTVDCATISEAAVTDPLARLDRSPRHRLLLLRGLHALTPVAARRVDEALRRAAAASSPVLVVGCLDAESVDPTRPYGLLLRHFHETVRVPALRYRVDELGEIAQSVLRSMTGGRSLRLSQQVVRVLEGYPWPGNVSELEDVLRYVVARKPVGVIQAPDLPALCFTSRAPRLSMLESAQCDAIIQALYEARGNRYRAAAMLGIARSSLYRKIDAFGISYIA